MITIFWPCKGTGHNKNTKGIRIKNANENGLQMTPNKTVHPHTGRH